MINDAYFGPDPRTFRDDPIQGRHAEIVPRAGSHFVMVDGQKMEQARGSGESRGGPQRYRKSVDG
jgi:hypothetical protein